MYIMYVGGTCPTDDEEVWNMRNISFTVLVMWYNILTGLLLFIIITTNILKRKFAVQKIYIYIIVLFQPLIDNSR